MSSNEDETGVKLIIIIIIIIINFYVLMITRFWFLFCTQIFIFHYMRKF